MRTLLRTRAGRTLAGVLGLLAIATAIAMALLWPSGETDELAVGLAAGTEGADVTRVETSQCPGGVEATCRSIEIVLTSGEASGETARIELGSTGTDPGIEVGDAVRVAAQEGAPGAPPSYTLSDFERRSPMLWLTLAFGTLVVVLGRLRGALSLLGLGGSLVIVLTFIVPAILEGSSALAVALVGAIAVMLVTISLAHGLSAKSLAAMLGTTASLILVVTLAAAFTSLANLTGLASEEATFLATRDTGISLQGLLLAGMVIGALGVLDDVTVSQSSTVMALRAANPALGPRELYGRAIEVGRDHISATVNTLVLAYVGASLPVLLIFSSGGIGFFDAVNVELVATEIVAMLVGSIGLIAAVPITTGLAALLATRLPEQALGDPGHVHSH